MEGGHDTFCPLGEEVGELHLRMAAVGGSRRGEPCRDEMAGLDGRGVQQRMKEGEELLVLLLVRGTSSEEEEDGPSKLGVSEEVELVLTEATSLQPWG